MLTRKPQPIAGVSSNYENVIEELYPSIGATGLGRFLNQLYESLPGPWGIRLSYLIFIPLTWPLALLWYLGQKVLGSKYVITNWGVKCVPVLGIRLLEEVSLSKVDRATVDPDSRLLFFRTGDVRLSNVAGETLMLLRGIPYPDRVCQVIEETRFARQATDASLATIRARK